VPPASSDVSQLFQAWGRGDVQAGEDLIPVVYRELRRRAAAYLRGERRDHTLQPTARVHEAYRRSGASADMQGLPLRPSRVQPLPLCRLARDSNACICDQNRNDRARCAQVVHSLRRHQAFQFFGPVQHNDQIRRRIAASVRLAATDDEEPSIGSSVVRLSPTGRHEHCEFKQHLETPGAEGRRPRLHFERKHSPTIHAGEE
jgi:ECF sigma factor